MKTIIIVIIALVSVSGQQKEVFFKTKKLKSGRLVLEPIENAFSTKGKLQGLLHPSSYFKRIFCDIPQSCFSKEQIDYLCNNNFYLVIFFNMHGDIMHIEYIFRDEEILKAISEKNLYKLYNLLKQTKLDTTKWGSIDKRYLNKNGKFDFATLNVSIINRGCNSCVEDVE